MSDAHRLSTPRGLALARMLATAPRSARLGHPSALPPPSCSLISPLLSAVCAQPHPPRTVGRARCHRRSLLRPRCQSPHRQVWQSLHRSAATALLRSQPASPTTWPGRLPAIRDHQWVCAVPLVLCRPFSAADEHPHGWPQLPLLQNPARDLGLKFEGKEGPKCTAYDSYE